MIPRTRKMSSWVAASGDPFLPLVAAEGGVKPNFVKQGIIP